METAVAVGLGLVYIILSPDDVDARNVLDQVRDNVDLVTVFGDDSDAGDVADVLPD